MANTRLIKKRVKSIKNIWKITKALEMVAASKIIKAQKAALAAKPYAQAIYELVGSLPYESETKEIPLMRIPEVLRSDLYLIISTNRGLAGSLNANLFRFGENFLLQKKGLKHFFVTVGKKGRSFAVRQGTLFADFSDEKDGKKVISALTKLVVDGFSDETFDEVYILYSEFVNALTQKPRLKKLLPISKSILEEELKRKSFELLGESEGSLEEKKQVKDTLPINFTFEPDRISVLASLLPFYLEVQIAEALYEADASEHSARMIAMKNASENASELSLGLTLLYNKERQGLITSEIIDITTAQLSIPNQNG